MSGRCIIVGASHAGTQVATRLQRLGWQGEIRLIGDEPHLPYHRPPLSKDYLKGIKASDKIQLQNESAYERSGVQLMLGAQVSSISRDNKSVTLATGGDLEYDKLVLAIGSSPRRLLLPGANLGGVCYLRNIEDVDRIRACVSDGGRAVVIGGGYIGLEAAASLRKLGMDVTVLEALDRVLQRVTSEPVSRFFTRVHREEGVDIRENAQVSAILGDSEVSGVELQSGEVIEACLVIIGIGVIPNTQLAEAAGLSIGNGIEVDAQARTNDPDIFAVGDCASFVHPKFGPVRLESVQNANDQGLVAARTICGETVEYDAVPWFWSDQYDVKLQIAGLTQGADDVVIRGNPESGRSVSVLYVRDHSLIAVDAMNSPRDFVMGKKLIADATPLDLTKLPDTTVPLNEAVA